MSKNYIKQKILDTIRDIPYGTVKSYGQVAEDAGVPGRARLVAKILTDSADVNLPWHRVLRSSGQIAFPKDSEMYLEQRNRLVAEGVLIVSGKVKMSKKVPDFDALFWAPK
jgi:methylated-DNA-protein-cysteine methyltransferase-like protein